MPLLIFFISSDYMRKLTKNIINFSTRGFIYYYLNLN